jgi:hypothetical protein
VERKGVIFTGDKELVESELGRGIREAENDVDRS